MLHEVMDPKELTNFKDQLLQVQRHYKLVLARDIKKHLELKDSSTIFPYLHQDVIDQQNEMIDKWAFITKTISGRLGDVLLNNEESKQENATLHELIASIPPHEQLVPSLIGAGQTEFVKKIQAQNQISLLRYRRLLLEGRLKTEAVPEIKRHFCALLIHLLDIHKLTVPENLRFAGRAQLRLRKKKELDYLALLGQEQITDEEKTKNKNELAAFIKEYPEPEKFIDDLLGDGPVLETIHK